MILLHRIVNSETYMDIIKQYKKTPIAIFSGHYHAAKIRQQGNIIHVSTPSLVTYPNAFRYVNITNYDDRTIFNFKYMVTGLEDVHKKSKLNVIASAALRGLPSDQETIITIRKSRDNNNDYVEEKTKVTREDRQMQKEAKEAQKEALKQEKIKADELKKLEQAQNKALKDEEKAKALELKKKQRELRKLEKAQDKAFKEDLKKQEKINKEAQKANAGN